MRIPTTAEMHESIDRLLATTRYVGPDVPVDRHGMPVVAPEPDDLDDE